MISESSLWQYLCKLCRTGAILTCPKLTEATEVVRGRQNALVIEAERKERLPTVKQVKLERLSDGLDGRSEGLERFRIYGVLLWLSGEIAVNSFSREVVDLGQGEVSLSTNEFDGPVKHKVWNCLIYYRQELSYILYITV